MKNHHHHFTFFRLLIFCPQSGACWSSPFCREKTWSPWTATVSAGGIQILSFINVKSDPKSLTRTFHLKSCVQGSATRSVWWGWTVRRSTRPTSPTKHSRLSGTSQCPSQCCRERTSYFSWVAGGYKPWLWAKDRVAKLARGSKLQVELASLRVFWLLFFSLKGYMKCSGSLYLFFL